jgi:hypothetical protein
MGLFVGANNSTQFDPDAGAFINATGIGGIEAEAINNLVNELKVGGVWGSILALYPYVGGTAQTCKFNLMNPQDTNAAYRLTFAGTWTFDAKGATPNGAAGTYADTYVNPSLTPFSRTSYHLSYYCPAQYVAGALIDIGQGDFNAVGESTITPRWTGDIAYFICYNSATTAGVFSVSGNTTTTGYWLSNRVSTGQQGWKNGTKLGTSVTNGAATANRTFFIAAENNGTGTLRNSPRKHIIDTMGTGLTDIQAFNLSNSVQKFVTTLGKL